TCWASPTGNAPGALISGSTAKPNSAAPGTSSEASRIVAAAAARPPRAVTMRISPQRLSCRPVASEDELIFLKSGKRIVVVKGNFDVYVSTRETDGLKLRTVICAQRIQHHLIRP